MVGIHSRVLILPFDQKVVSQVVHWFERKKSLKVRTGLEKSRLRQGGRIFNQKQSDISELQVKLPELFDRQW